MKKALTLVAFSLLFGATYAQLADGTKAPAFTSTDINGNQQVLYDYLNAGKTVIIDIFATWCGPCWTIHQNHVLEDLYAAYGPAGTDELMIMSIEGDNTTSHADLLGTGTNTQGNWVAGTTFPIIEDSSIPGLFNLTYWPTIYMIRPSGNMILINDYVWQNILEPQQDWVYSLATRGNDDVLAHTTLTDKVFCSPTFFTGSTQIKNMGRDTVKNVIVDMMFNGNVVQSKTWTGNLTEFKSANVAFSSTNVSETTTISFVARMPNGVDDTYPSDNQDDVFYNFPVASTAMDFSITTDFWPEEVGWQLVDPNGNVLYSNADLGTLSCNTSYQQTFVLSEQGCHRLVLTDVYGDGLLNGPINPGSHNCPNSQDSIALGAISLSSNGVVFYDNISYGTGITVPFKYDESAAVKPIDNLEYVKAYPNPATDFVDLDLNLNANTDLALDVLDINGKQLMQRMEKNYSAGQHVEHLDVSNLANGTYFIRLTQKDKVNTIKFTIVN